MRPSSAHWLAGEAEDGGLDALRRAAELYRGVLLEGLEPSDCPAFDEWLFFQRDSLEQRAMDMLQRLVDGLLAPGRLPGCIGLCTAAGGPEPAARRRPPPPDAGPWRAGRRDGVRRQYRLCADVLERELGVEPAAKLQALYRALIAVQPAPIVSHDQPLSTTSRRNTRSRCPFWGANESWRRWETSSTGPARARGAWSWCRARRAWARPGWWKSFLGRCAGRAREQPVRHLAGRCYAPESRAPYAMWADALQELAQPDWQPHWPTWPQVWRQQLARLVPALGPPADDIEGATLAESRLRLLQGIVQALVHLAQAGVLCLWFDDLHWADEASLELLHYVSRHTTAQSLFILGTYRPDAAADNPALDQLLQGSHRHHTVPLGVARRGDHPPDAAGSWRSRARQTWPSASTGTATATRFSGRDAQHPVRVGQTAPQAGWQHGRAATAEPWPVPPRIQDLIQARMASLDEEQRRALAAGAVIGRPFGLRLLRQVSGLPELQALDAVEQARGAGSWTSGPEVFLNDHWPFTTPISSA